MRVTTDIDMRNPQRFQAVSAYLEGDTFRMTVKDVGQGYELWLRDAAKTRLEFHPVTMWVDHGKKQVSSEPPSADEDRVTSDDSKRSL
jgi:hypothetical protein